MTNPDQKTETSRQQTWGWIAAAAGLALTGYSLYRELTRYDLRHKVVLVTGGSRGLGLVLCRQLADKGARIALCARSSDQLQKAANELTQRGATVLPLQADLTDRNKVQEVVLQVIEHYGTLDVLINNAGIVQVGPAEAMDIGDYEKAMQTNFWAPLYAIRAALPHFLSRGEGRIVNVTSIGGKIALPHLLPYTASKFALTGFSEGLHAELKKYNIHVTTVVPNLMRTGSPRNIDVKGNHEAEYAWFKTSDSLPLLSQSVEAAAHKIIRALEYGDAEAILTFVAKAATVVQGLVPSWVNTAMSLANLALPANVPGGDRTKKGYESESDSAGNAFTAITDKEAVKNNQL